MSRDWQRCCQRKQNALKYTKNEITRLKHQRLAEIVSIVINLNFTAKNGKNMREIRKKELLCEEISTIVHILWKWYQSRLIKDVVAPQNCLRSPLEVVPKGQTDIGLYSWIRKFENGEVCDSTTSWSCRYHSWRNKSRKTSDKEVTLGATFKYSGGYF